MITMSEIGPENRDFVTRTHLDSWGGPIVVGHGERMDASALPGFVALLDGEPAGVITYAARGDAWEVVTIDAVIPGRGVGRALLDAVKERAVAQGARRLWLITTNDNTHALRFYQRYGFDLVALRRDAMTPARELKPQIPLTADGIPIRHELELEIILR